MKLKEELKKDLINKYQEDLLHAKVKPIGSKEQAERMLGALSQYVDAKNKRPSPFSRAMKLECIRLVRNNRRYHNQEDGVIEAFYTRLTELDLEYIEECEWNDEFAGYLLASSCNLAKWNVTEQYKKFRSGVYARIHSEVEALLRADRESAVSMEKKLNRHFILHIGGTNSGKTYMAIERLKTAKHGVYAGPLRLLALEIYDKMTEAGVPCSMITGQEQYETAGSRVAAATVEMVQPYEGYDIAVIDEVQMINDPYRGHMWLNLITRISAEEIHLCMAPEVERIVTGLLTQNGEDYEIIRHERNTELIFETERYNINTDIKRGDALILFSKKEVLDVAARLEQRGVAVSTIYGNLPPQTRKRQFEMFLKGETEVVVATDAIGLGVNLPIRRIVFMATMKFDGKERRYLNEYEVRQIAGRAGRRGIYDQGYVTALSVNNIQWLKERYHMDHQLEYARIGFPKALLDIQGPLDVILEEWDRIQPEYEMFRKIDIKETLRKYRILYPLRNRIQAFSDNRELFDIVSCDVDLGNEECIRLWKNYCLNYNGDTSLKFPKMENIWAATLLEKAETYYKQLDLYNQFSRRMGKNMEEEHLARARVEAERLITEELGRSKENYLRRCQRCGKLMPMEAWGKYCGDCEERESLYRKSKSRRH